MSEYFQYIMMEFENLFLFNTTGIDFFSLCVIILFGVVGVLGLFFLAKWAIGAIKAIGKKSSK